MQRVVVAVTRYYIFRQSVVVFPLCRKYSLLKPHPEQVLEDGYRLAILRTSLPIQTALYVRKVANVAQQEWGIEQVPRQFIVCLYFPLNEITVASLETTHIPTMLYSDV